MTLYVRNIPYSADQDVLRRHFEVVGPVSRVRVPLDRETSRPRGFAFVEMTTEEATDRAIKELDGSSIGGRAIRVDRSREDR